MGMLETKLELRGGTLPASAGRFSFGRRGGDTIELRHVGWSPRSRCGGCRAFASGVLGAVLWFS